MPAKKTKKLYINGDLTHELIISRHKSLLKFSKIIGWAYQSLYSSLQENQASYDLFMDICVHLDVLPHVIGLEKDQLYWVCPCCREQFTLLNGETQ